MRDRNDDRLTRTTITPQILYHTFQEVQGRGIDLTKDPDWGAVRYDISSARRQRLTFRQSQNLILRAMSLANDPDLGLAVGFRQTFASVGLLSAAMLASATLRDALEVGIRYHRVTGSMLEFENSDYDGDHSALVIRSRFAGSPIRRFLMQEALVLILKSTGFLAPKGNPIVEVRTPFRPKNRQQLEALCRCKVDYNGDTQMILYRKSDLSIRLETADPFAFSETQAVLDHLLQQELAEVDILQSVEARIMRRLPEVESLGEISAALGLSERGLRRRLAACGTTYRALLKQLRLDRARQRLEEGTASRDQIANEVGFSDARSLRRLLKN